MSFFDSKEEIVNIELTQYGKYLISQGKFHPSYYAFFDEDVIYDSNFMGISESQNSTQDRILNETPTNKPSYNFVSIEATSRQDQNLIVTKDFPNIEKIEEGLSLVSNTEFSNVAPIGTADLNSQYYPAWNINAINGIIDSVDRQLDNTNEQQNLGMPSPFLQIPQIQAATGSYVIHARKKEEDIRENEEILLEIQNDSGEIDVYVTGDKSKLLNLYDVLEKNTIDNKENFEIEVFVENTKKDVNNNDKKYWEKLFFFKKPTNIKNNILLDDYIYKEVEKSFPDSTNVEYYFDLLVDEEIDLPESAKDKLKSILNSLTTGGGSTGVGAGVGLGGTIYGSDITDADKPFGEDC